MTEKTFEEFIDSCELELKENYKNDEYEQLISKHHTLFDFTLTFPNGKSFLGKFQCNTLYSYPDEKSVLEYIILDAVAYNDYTDLAQFLYEYGYTENAISIRKGINAYEACKRTYEFFKDMNDVDMFDLLDCFNDNFEQEEEQDDE